MSRIHEALKKAEQERAAIQLDGPTKESTGQQLSSRTAQLTAESEPLPAAAALVDTVVPADSERSLVEDWQANCVKATWNPDPNFLLFSNANPFAAGVEQFRTLRSRLHRLRETRPMRKILVSSSVPKEGKTFVAANLAQAFARQAGCRVLLIDADLRNPCLHKALGAPLTPGLADYLQGGYIESEVIQQGTEDGFFFLPAGKHVTHPAELIANKKFNTLLANVSDRFDWVILDSPPALPVSDPSVIATMCDGVLFVVRAGSTPAEVCSRGCRELQDAPIVGVVLNDLEKGTTSDPYYGYSTAGYGSTLSNAQGKSS